MIEPFSQIETCNGFDDDCDGIVDEDAVQANRRPRYWRPLRLFVVVVSSAANLDNYAASDQRKGHQSIVMVLTMIAMGRR